MVVKGSISAGKRVWFCTFKHNEQIYTLFFNVPFGQKKQIDDYLIEKIREKTGFENDIIILDKIDV